MYYYYYYSWLYVSSSTKLVSYNVSNTMTQSIIYVSCLESKVLSIRPFYICVYMYIYVYIYIYMYIYVYVYIYICVCVYIVYKSMSTTYVPNYLCGLCMSVYFSMCTQCLHCDVYCLREWSPYPSLIPCMCAYWAIKADLNSDSDCLFTSWLV